MSFFDKDDGMLDVSNYLSKAYLITPEAQLLSHRLRDTEPEENLITASLAF